MPFWRICWSTLVPILVPMGARHWAAAACGVGLLAAVCLLTLESPSRSTVLGESRALAMAEAEFGTPSSGGAAALDAGGKVEGSHADGAQALDAEINAKGTAALLQQLPMVNAKAKTAARSALAQRAESDATMLVDKAFAKAMADAKGKATADPVPVYAATWEPKDVSPVAAKARAAKRLAAKAAGEARVRAPAAAPTAAAAQAREPAIVQQKAARPIAHTKARRAPKAVKARSDWLKALNRPMDPTLNDFKVGVDVEKKVDPSARATWKDALARTMDPNLKSVAQVLAAAPQGAQLVMDSKTPLCDEKHPEHCQGAEAMEAKAKKVVPVETKPVTGEALVSKWMQALGLSSKTRPSKDPAPVAPQAQQGLAVAPPAAEAQQSAAAVAAPKQQETLPPADHTAEGLETKPKGNMAEWMAALNRKPASMFVPTVFSDGNRPTPANVQKHVPVQARQAEAKAVSVPKQQHATKTVALKTASKQQRLSTSEAWAKALGGAGAMQTQAAAAAPGDGDFFGNDFFGEGDVLVKLKAPMMPDGNLQPGSVERGTKSASKLAVPGRAPHTSQQGGLAVWREALGRKAGAAQFKGRDSMLSETKAKTQTSLRYSAAIMREAIEKGESPKAVALEHATRGTMGIVDPFVDARVPADTAGFRTLWGN